MAKAVAKTSSEQDEIDHIVSFHLEGKQVMGAFKSLLTRLLQTFVTEFQQRRSAVLADPKMVAEVLGRGKELATRNAVETLNLVRSALDNPIKEE